MNAQEIALGHFKYKDKIDNSSNMDSDGKISEDSKTSEIL